jgi:hypothetical protein
MHALAVNVRSSAPIEIALNTKGVDRRPKLRRYVDRRITSSLGRFARRIREVTVWLEDVNGPRGGVDIRCRLDIHLRPWGRISVAALASDEFAATANAAARARELVDRRLKRVRDRRRRSPRT